MSGWSVVKLETQKPAKQIKPLLENKIGEYDDISILKVEGEVIVRLGGYGREAEAEEMIRSVKPKRASAIHANNTSDAGDGEYYEFDEENDEMELVDTKDGYEGANANDVAGYFRDEYNFQAPTR